MLLNLMNMKRILMISGVFLLASCQELKWPVAKVLGWSLPDAEPVEETVRIPASYDVAVLDTAGNKHMMSEFKGKLIFFDVKM